MANELKIAHEQGMTIYALLFDETSAEVYDAAGDNWEAYALAQQDNYDIALTGNTGGFYVADFPAAINTAKNVTAVYYERVGATPNGTNDVVIHSERIVWSGSARIYPATEAKQDIIVALETTIADENPDGSDTDRTFTLAAGPNNSPADDNIYRYMSISVVDVSGGVTATKRVESYVARKVTVDYAFEFPLAIGDIVRIWADNYSTTAGAAAAGEIADAVWEEASADHQTPETTGDYQRRTGNGCRAG